MHNEYILHQIIFQPNKEFLTVEMRHFGRFIDMKVHENRIFSYR